MSMPLCYTWLLTAVTSETKIRLHGGVIIVCNSVTRNLLFKGWDISIPGHPFRRIQLFLD